MLADLREQFPTLGWPDRNTDEPERDVLPLPSNLPVVLHARRELQYMVTAERQLREARASDSLREVRNKLGLTSFLWKSTSGQFGQAAKTRNGKALKGVYDRIKELRGVYNYTREKLIVLGEPQNSRNYRPLTEHDCRALVVEHGQEKPGGSKKPGVSWLWKDDVYVEDMSKWQVEGLCAIWVGSRGEY